VIKSIVNCSFALSSWMRSSGESVCGRHCAWTTKPPTWTWRAERWLEMLIHHRLHARQGLPLVCKPFDYRFHPSNTLRNVCSDQASVAGLAHPPIDSTAALPPPVSLHLFILDNKPSSCSPRRQPKQRCIRSSSHRSSPSSDTLSQGRGLAQARSRQQAAFARRCRPQSRSVGLLQPRSLPFCDSRI